MAKAKSKKPELTPSQWHGSEALDANLVLVDALIEDPKNARGHDDKSVSAIAASLNRFGQVRPIVVRNGVVLAGNGTLQAARLLGWSQIAVLNADHLNDAEAKAFAIADNRTAELSHWNFDVLASTIKDLEHNSDDILHSLGWSDRDLAVLLKDDAKMAVDVDGHVREINTNAQIMNDVMYSIIVENLTEKQQLDLIEYLTPLNFKFKAVMT